MEHVSPELRLLRITHPYDHFLKRRLEVISSHFASDPFSIDAIVLAGALLTALGNRRYRRRNSDQENFEQLLLEFWHHYVDRVSIPQLVEWLRRKGPDENALIVRIERDFPIQRDYGRIRQVTDDPSRAAWQAWCQTNGIEFTDHIRIAYSYGRMLYRDFRNSVQHSLEIADGREARPITFDRPFFYTNLNGRMLFGFNHPDLEGIVRDVIAGLRAWAVANMDDIFQRQS